MPPAPKSPALTEPPGPAAPCERRELAAAVRHIQDWARRNVHLGHILLLLCLQRLLYPLYFSYTRLPEDSYFSSSLLGEIMTHRGTLMLLGLILVSSYVGWKRGISWSTLDDGLSLRILIGTTTVMLAWAFSTYDINLYYGEGHYVDRLALVALAVLVFRSPHFVPPFLLLAYTIAWQFQYPLGMSWTDKLILFNVLAMFHAYLCLRPWLPIGSRVFIFVVLCAQASNYFIPSWSKLVIGWLAVEQLDNLFVGSYVNGWLAFLDEGQMLRIASVVRMLNPILIWTALLIELSAILLLFHKRMCVTILTLCAFLHAVIFATSGIFFWKWIALDVALVVVLSRSGRKTWQPTFNRWAAAMSVLVIWYSPSLFHPFNLAWYDTGLYDYYSVEVVTSEGKTHPVPRLMMSPYELVFAQNRFYYLSEVPILTGTYGATASQTIVEELEKTDSEEEVLELSRQYGRSSYDKARVARFEDFVQRYFGERNRRKSKHVVPRWLVAPHHIWSHGTQDGFDDQATVEKVRIIHEQKRYADGRLIVLGQDVVCELRIRSPRSSDSASRTFRNRR